ncbi:hypothetical protein BGZ94_004387 [Podila epigama]|nr:hypothetical protein BGZ94_004387 [Podila epigama]
MAILILSGIAFCAGMYAVAWLVYWSMAAPLQLSAMPLHPTRIWKINKAVVGVIVSNITLLPTGISLIIYRYFTMRNSTKASGMLTNVQYRQGHPSSTLDIYIPDNNARTMDSRTFRRGNNATIEPKRRPVIVFIYGGGWASGSKWLYTLVGARLRDMGYVVFIPEYAVFPKGSIYSMEQEVKSAILWTFKHCAEFGGDPQRMYLMGHSAGAHLCALAVWNDCIRQTPRAMLFGDSTPLSKFPILSSILQEVEGKSVDCDRDNTDREVLPRLRGMMLYSGVYDIGEHYLYESMRGVEEISAMGRLMGNSETTFRRWSPKFVLKELIETATPPATMDNEEYDRHQKLLRYLKTLLPVKTLVVHGDNDKTVPLKSSTEFFAEMKALQPESSVQLQVMKGMGHEEPVVGMYLTYFI